mmetsp:Transcript_25889/g.34373  ORF Transcript_25889/g.34373 Transcript_25889/m.34373 type:complete len:119 (-) Transcript_25889:4044-4400(-)
MVFQNYRMRCQLFLEVFSLIFPRIYENTNRFFPAFWLQKISIVKRKKDQALQQFYKSKQRLLCGARNQIIILYKTFAQDKMLSLSRQNQDIKTTFSQLKKKSISFSWLILQMIGGFSP